MIFHPDADYHFQQGVVVFVLGDSKIFSGFANNMEFEQIDCSPFDSI